MDGNGNTDILGRVPLRLILFVFQKFCTYELELAVNSYLEENGNLL